jgi:hypothetical protein
VRRDSDASFKEMVAKLADERDARMKRYKEQEELKEYRRKNNLDRDGNPILEGKWWQCCCCRYVPPVVEEEEEPDEDFDEDNLTPRTKLKLAKANAMYMEAMGITIAKPDSKLGAGGTGVNASGSVEVDVEGVYRREQRRKQREEEAAKNKPQVVSAKRSTHGQRTHPLERSAAAAAAPRRRRASDGDDDEQGRGGAGAGAGAGAGGTAATSQTDGVVVLRRDVFGAADPTGRPRRAPPALRVWRDSETDSGTDGEL